MLLSPMRYKDYIWPHNPASYSITYERLVASHKIPFGRYCMQDLGLSCRVMRGRGEFAGADAYEEFKRMNAAVIGISKDSAASHKKFAEKHGLPFILLSDPELTAIRGYGVWQEKKNYGKVSMGVVRSTFVISEYGVIERVMPKVKPDTNAAEVLAYLKGEA